MATQYYEIEGFENIYLEDSYVMKITENSTSVVFYIEAVLTENHEYYSPPRPGEHYCYRNAIIVFTGIDNIEWINKTANSSSKIEEMGNIDIFYCENGCYFLSGDWGSLKIVAKVPFIRFLN